jgi:hypothetical protein
MTGVKDLKSMKNFKRNFFMTFIPFMPFMLQSSLETLPYAPQRMVVYRTGAPLVIDGNLDEPAWTAATWSDPFVDIQGDTRPRPRFRTRVKMLWSAEALYVAAEMEEPDLWATLTERESVIFHDNDFEVFIDPDGDTHNYYELEVNALRTTWDLMLPTPYRDGGPPIDAWDINGLAVGVTTQGTLNRPGDRDEGWTVEIAMPWKSLREAAPGQKTPKAGDHWRVNFSRVEWTVDVKDGVSTKRRDAKGALLPEDNWVWSPQGAIDMHMPERWGIVQFSDRIAGTGVEAFVEDRSDRVRWALRRLYYRQRQFRAANGRWAPDLASLRAAEIRVDGLTFQPQLESTASLFEIRAAAFDGDVVHIRQDGKTWTTRAGPAK